jgi:hypothetical protein
MLKNITNPKSTYLFLFFIVTFVACTNKASNENNDTLKVSAEGTNVVENKTETAMSDNLLANILTTKSNIERSAMIGKSLGQLQAQETADLADSASNYKGYTQYFNNSEEEFVDIQYFNNGELVTAVNFDIYLNKQADVSNLYDELLAKFNTKYGKATSKEKENKWNLPNNQSLLLKDVSVKLAPGLQVTFAIKNTNTTIE